MNWIEKVVEEIFTDFHTKLQELGYSKTAVFPPMWETRMAKIILSHAPVIDAEKLADVMIGRFWRPKIGLTGQGYAEATTKVLKEAVQLITDNIDLKIEWVKANTIRTEIVASYGQFHLYACDSGVDGWTALLYFDAHRIMKKHDLKSLELAKQACVGALKGIITGVKE